LALHFVLLSLSALALSIKSLGWREAPSCSGCQPAGSILYQPAGSINPLVPFYINVQPPWPGLEFLLLLGQAKRRNFTIVTTITTITFVTLQNPLSIKACACPKLPALFLLAEKSFKSR